MIGKTVCRTHGGTTPVGIASPSYKTGRYSKHLPARLRESYETAAADPELLQMNHDIALLDTRLSELMAALDTSGVGQVWRTLGETWADLQRARASQDSAGLAVALHAIGELIDSGLADTDRWQELANLLERRRKLVETEMKRQQALQQMVTATEAMTLIAAVAESVRRHVTDRATLQAIQTDITRFTHYGTPRQAGE